MFRFAKLSFIAVICLLFGYISCKKPAVPMACFNFNSNIVGQPDTFTNCSKNAGSYKWYFGDGDSDLTDASPVHTYANSGTYSVRLVASDNSGKQSVSTQSVIISPPSVTGSNYAGTFSGTQSCSSSGASNYNVTITATGTLGININNLNNSGKNFQANLTSDSTANIPPQVYNNGTGNILLQGSIAISSDFHNLQVSLIVTSFGARDVCQTSFIRQ
jgi:PKD repeat protein